jgi:hypothetical protein
LDKFQKTDRAPMPAAPDDFSAFQRTVPTIGFGEVAP